LEVVERLADEPVDLLEINISCPNVKHGGIAFGQDPKAVEAKAASCYAEGNIAYWTCENCDVLFADEACTQETTAEAVKLKTLAHTWGEGVVTEEATCTTTGLMEYECTVEECTATKTEVIDALNHSGVTAETKWDSDETNHWKTCPDCGESVQSGEHNYVDGKCSICGVDDSTTENPYVITQTAQLWLIEPWALRANMRLYHPSTDGMSAYGAILTKDEFEENIQDYGVFFIRESDLDKPVEDLTVEDIINHPNAIHKTKADGGVKYDAAEGKLYSDFDEGIYTYEFKDSVI